MHIDHLLDGGGRLFDRAVQGRPGEDLVVTVVWARHFLVLRRRDVLRFETLEYVISSLLRLNRNFIVLFANLVIGILIICNQLPVLHQQIGRGPLEHLVLVLGHRGLLHLVHLVRGVVHQDLRHIRAAVKDLGHGRIVHGHLLLILTLEQHAGRIAVLVHVHHFLVRSTLIEFLLSLKRIQTLPTHVI